MIGVRVNGTEERVDAGETLARLVVRVTGAEERRGFAAAVNGEVVPRSRWDEVVLVEGDDVEVAAPFQGG